MSNLCTLFECLWGAGHLTLGGHQVCAADLCWSVSAGQQAAGCIVAGTEDSASYRPAGTGATQPHPGSWLVQAPDTDAQGPSTDAHTHKHALYSSSEVSLSCTMRELHV